MAEIASSNSAPVEARSLSSITPIASNPPAYPRNNSQARLDPIELYIVRVPGSKDVVLTPLKPPTKSNVSIEAINSSLYYLHAATEEDENVLRSIESEQEQQVEDGPGAWGLPSESIARLNDFHRKPVGGKDSSPPPPPPPPHRDGLANLGIREGLQQSTHDHYYGPSSPIAPLRRDPVSSQFTIPRRPVSSSGNPPATANTSRVGQIFSHDEVQPLRESQRTQQQLLPERSPLGGRSETMKSSLTSTDQSSSPSFHITVIRRDTATGNQWNVGTISSSSADQGVIHIEILNPGYGKFIDNAPLPMATMGQSAAEILQQMAKNIQHDDHDHAGKRAFFRDVVPIKHSHHHHHHHHHSLSGSLFNRSSGSADTSKLANAISGKISRGYYSFQSPWNGTCSFVASINGGGLKCKHVIPGPSMSMDGRAHSDEVTVSELRYNIPFPLQQTFRPSSTISLDSSGMSPRGKEKGKRAALGQLITSNIEKVQQRARAHSQGGLRSSEERSPSPSSAAVADEDRLDLSLAREAGGGGMSGKSAKLGKLIIQDEGIKMIDLVVAASMGVWWRTSYQHQLSARN